MVWLSTKENLTLLVIICYSLIQRTKAMPMNSRKLKRESGGTDADILLRRFMQSTPAKISYYGKYPVGTSSCSLDPVPPLLSEKKWVLAAVSKDDYLNSLICGTCLRISVIDLASREDPEDIFAAVIDQCNDCQKGEINLYADGKVTQKANYEAIDCGRNIADSLIVRIQQATEDSKKVQIRNSLLPISSLENYANGKWKCMPREIDNYFLYKEISPQTSAQFRATSISGQTIGFTLEDFNSIKEVKLSKQFQPFHTATLAGKNVSVQCQDQRSFDSIDLYGKLGSRSKGYQHEDVSITGENQTIKSVYEVKTDGRMSNARNLTKEFEVYQPAINASFCKGKADGPYAQDSDCERFTLCAQGKTLSKRCPNGLRYNAKVGVCDWASNVACGELNRKAKKTVGDEANNDNDEEVYTKKFIGRTKLNETNSVVEN